MAVSDLSVRLAISHSEIDSTTISTFERMNRILLGRTTLVEFAPRSSRIRTATKYI